MYMNDETLIYLDAMHLSYFELLTAATVETMESTPQILRPRQIL